MVTMLLRFKSQTQTEVPLGKAAEIVPHSAAIALNKVKHWFWVMRVGVQFILFGRIMVMSLWRD